MESDIVEDGRFYCSCNGKARHERRSRECTRIIKGGTKQAGLQCLNCGRFDVIAFKDFKGNLDDQVDLKILEEFENRRNQYYESRRIEFAKNQKSKSDEWWEWYGNYLHTDQWREKRRKVLNRDDHVCQSCLDRDATEVHHLTYARVGNEPLFDLIAVCSECHREIHNK